MRPFANGSMSLLSALYAQKIQVYGRGEKERRGSVEICWLRVFKGHGSFVVTMIW